MSQTHRIKSVKFYAKVPQQDGGHEIKPTFFSVQHAGASGELYITYHERYFVIRQGTVPGDFKQYLYKLEDINGRIEVEE